MINYVYLHIPFCLRKCGYCSFFSIPLSDNEGQLIDDGFQTIASIPTITNYVSDLIKEIKLYKSVYKIEPHTIYFGGGTPSLLASNDIEKILSQFDLSSLQECTIEVNPATVDEKSVRKLASLPINRISLGVQSFNDDELKMLGRLHTAADNYKTFNLFRENGFDNISIDIIYGLPACDREDTVSRKVDVNYHLKRLSETLISVKKLNPEHISCYCLSLEKDTPMARKGVKLPPDEISANIYRYLRKEVVKMGYEQYEISNFAKTGRQSLHNSGYWKMKNYLGLGAGAHSFVNDIRFSTPESLADYSTIVNQENIFPNKVHQTSDDIRQDYVIQGLRLTKGIDFEEYRNRFHEDFISRHKKAIDKYKDYLVIERNSLRLSKLSYFVSNEIIAEFLD